MSETQVTITIENLAPEQGIGIAQTWYAFHDGSFDLYDTGETASRALEIIAEDGITGIEPTVPGLIEEAISFGAIPANFPPVEETVAGQFDASSAGTNGGTQGMVFTDNREPPFFLVQDAGQTISTTVTLDTDNIANNRFFSYATMLFPTNDGFVANDDPQGIEIFDEEGNFIGADFTIAGTDVLDAGTEVNDEDPTNVIYELDVIGNSVDENGTVQNFPGFLAAGEGGVVDFEVDGETIFANADFTAEDYQVARITVTETPPEPEPVEVTVTIENLAPDAGTFLTPFWVGFHDGDFDTYDRGRPISPGLESLVEDGNTEALTAEFAASGDGTLDGTIAGAGGAIEGPIDPGETTTATFTIDPNDETHQFFSYASMVIPSNDAFISNGNPSAFQLFDEEGNFVGADFIVTGRGVLDGGTEVNDELAENTAFFSQTAPNTGVDENGVVNPHPGFIEGGRILSEDGTTEGVPEGGFTNADFTAEDYQIARISVSIGDRSEEQPLEIAEPVSITSTLDGDQEVDGGDTEASGESTLTLNNTGDGLEYSLTVSGLDFGANGLIEGGATTEDTTDDVTRLHIHNAARGDNGSVIFSLFDTVTPELGNSLGIGGNQDEDLTVTANDDGSVTLTGVWDEADPTTVGTLSDFVSEIRNGTEDEDLNFYWNVHTEEFPAGAIRGQLVTNNEEDTPPEPEPLEVVVTIENLAPDAGTFLTPFWVGFHDGDFDTYDRGRPISPGLESLVEDGNTEAFSAEFAASGDGTIDGTIAGAGGAIEGPIDPGETTSATFTLDANDETNQFFSYASMVIPSNDAFVSNGNPMAHSLFDEEGNFIGADFIIAGSNVLDGGTEFNSESAETTAFFSQAAPNTGGTQNGVVTTHPGFIEGGRILSEDGTTEGAPEGGFTNADFTADGYQVARVTVSVVDDPVSIISTLDGEQEVDEGDPDASGTSTLTLNDLGNSLEYSLTVTGLDFGANGLIEGGATTEDTNDDVTRLHIHNAPRGENGDVVFSLFDTVAPELGNALDIQGNQDEDLTVTANDDGSVTLTGVWEGTDPSSTALSEFVDDFRSGEIGTDLDFYWNVHTEEFPAGAIRGQLEVAEAPQPETIELFRFRNTTFDTGTYVFVGAEERDAILADENLSNSFALDGVQDDGSVNPAFTASTTPGDDLLPFFRLASLAVPGTFLYVSTEELNDIFADGSDQQDQWERQGFNEEGEDIPEFYLFGAGAERGLPFNRFQNNANNTFLFASSSSETGQSETDFINNDPDLSAAFTDQGPAFESLT